MKYFIDFEFIEGFHKPMFGKRRHFIDLISVGICSLDGRQYHAISSEYNYRDASQWVKENVIIPLYTQTVHGDRRNVTDADTFHKEFGYPNSHIAAKLLEFIYEREEVDYHIGILGNKKAERVNSNIELIGYYSAYDHVLLCSLFGTMMDLPKGFPMYTTDLIQKVSQFASDPDRWIEKNVQPAENEHNALSDAKWTRDLWAALPNSLK